MTELEGASVFLSASFPSADERGRRFDADPGVIADAVAAVSEALLRSGARIVCGGHPTITPLLLFICDQGGYRERLDIYQSERYRSQIPQETWRLSELRYGTLHFTPDSDDPAADLTLMRRTMLDEARPDAAVFIGGMDGIFKEQAMAAQRGVLCLPVAASGGAAAQIAALSNVENGDAQLMASASFALVGREIVRTIRDRRLRGGPASS